jgi:organic radical activating enzyme
MNFKCNCCDGIYNSFDVHLTPACDNKCKHCIDAIYEGKNIVKPNAKAIAKTIINNSEGYDDVLFLGGEPCLFLEELYECIVSIKESTSLKCYITSSMPKTCKDKYELFLKILDLVDGFNISAQHYNECIADKIRNTESKYDRQEFYASLPHKEKIRINLNIVKPYLYTKEDILNTLKHYDDLGFPEIKLSEIQHGKDYFVSFEKTMGIKLKSPFTYGCQTWVDMKPFIPGFKGKLLLKRSCFMCEETLKATFTDGLKVAYKYFCRPKDGHYAVVYEDGSLSNGWI